MNDSTESALDLLAECGPGEHVTFDGKQFLRVRMDQIEVALEFAFRGAVQEALRKLGTERFHQIASLRVTPESLMVVEIEMSDGRRACGSAQVDYQARH